MHSCCPRVQPWGRCGPVLPQVPDGGELVPTGQNLHFAILDFHFSLQGPSQLKSAGLPGAVTPLACCLTTTKPFDFALPGACGSICVFFVLVFLFSIVCCLFTCFFFLLLTYIFLVFSCSVSIFINFFVPLFLSISNVMLVCGLFVLPYFSFFLMFLLLCLTHFSQTLD